MKMEKEKKKKNCIGLQLAPMNKWTEWMDGWMDGWIA